MMGPSSGMGLGLLRNLRFGPDHLVAVEVLGGDGQEDAGQDVLGADAGEAARQRLLIEAAAFA
jgi:hypothetical protein